jgi:hypothetical protein
MEGKTNVHYAHLQQNHVQAMIPAITKPDTQWVDSFETKITRTRQKPYILDVFLLHIQAPSFHKFVKSFRQILSLCSVIYQVRSRSYIRQPGPWFSPGAEQKPMPQAKIQLPHRQSMYVEEEC